jgi:hypothetical protein
LGLQRDYDQKANIHLISGVSSGLIVCGLYILWDRWVIASLFALDRWGLINTLFDFSTTYRATGIVPRGGIGTCPVDRPCNIEEHVKGTELIPPSGTITCPRCTPGVQPSMAT